MKRIFYYILTGLLINSCTPSGIVSNGITAGEALTNNIKVSLIKTNSNQKDYHKLLMFGGGSQAVRLFLDNLSGKLSSDFGRKNI